MREPVILLLLMVTQGAYGIFWHYPFMKMFHPTGYNCRYAEPGGVMMDPDTQLLPGQHLTVASTYEVEKHYVQLSFYICPAEIPTEVNRPWTFDCRKRVPVTIIQDMHSATLDVKMMYYFNVTLTTIRIPHHISCKRCGLMVEATMLRHPTCKRSYKMRSCAFISVNRRFPPVCPPRPIVQYPTTPRPSVTFPPFNKQPGPYPPPATRPFPSEGFERPEAPPEKLEIPVPPPGLPKPHPPPVSPDTLFSETPEAAGPLLAPSTPENPLRPETLFPETHETAGPLFGPKAPVNPCHTPDMPERTPTTTCETDKHIISFYKPGEEDGSKTCSATPSNGGVKFTLKHFPESPKGENSPSAHHYTSEPSNGLLHETHSDNEESADAHKDMRLLDPGFIPHYPDSTAERQFLPSQLPTKAGNVVYPNSNPSTPPHPLPYKFPQSPNQHPEFHTEFSEEEGYERSYSRDHSSLGKSEGVSYRSNGLSHLHDDFMEWGHPRSAQPSPVPANPGKKYLPYFL